MKSSILLVLTILLLAGGCKEDTFYSNAVITGYDGRMCACCGGLMINFSNQTKPYAGDFYLIENSADQLGIPNNATFPIYAEVTYTKLSKCQSISTHYIRISSFVRVK